VSILQAITLTDRGPSAAKTWMKALELTAPISRQPERLLSNVIEELAAQCSDSPALLSERESLTYGSLLDRANQYARWALGQGLAKGEVVGLLMTNRPEYFAIWLGITSVGGVVAFLNSNLVGPSLIHCIHVANPKHLIVETEYLDSLKSSLPGLTSQPTIWSHGANNEGFERIDRKIQSQSTQGLNKDERRPLTIEDQALYIFTSGTTGLPKAACVSHARILQWSYWFAGMMGAGPCDRMYNCLPMYHSIGGVVVPGAALVVGGSVVIRDKFSASQFWSDICRWDCTTFQYIGELCRYLLHATPPAEVPEHRVRLACGNGLAPDVWDEFKSRFRIPRILEFYAATEGNVSLFNVEGKPGAIGRIPPYLAHRYSPALVKFDADKGEPLRDGEGFCVRCNINEPGEALGRIDGDSSNIGSRFDGYTDEQQSASKVLRSVFGPGDAWYRTGDLMRKDEQGFFYFVDRVGDTFRWKGENVSTAEVSEAIRAIPGVKHAIVYGVAISAMEGRAGMAAVTADRELNLSALREGLIKRLPAYARPLFLRVQAEVEVTGTFKYSKADLARQGCNPEITSDVIYFDNPEQGAFQRLDRSLFDRIQRGQIRL
jgi:fatty-acyl-CoA synthase